MNDPVCSSTSDVEVTLQQFVGGDEAIAKAAQVSVLGSKTFVEESAIEEPDKTAGLIDFLLKNRHGTPFEHNSMTFLVSAPIFVFREWHRHRIGWSYNEESGRYKVLDPKFYVPGDDRPLVQEGKAGHYTYVPGTPQQMWETRTSMEACYVECYRHYQEMLDKGIAREVARMVLPVGIFSSMWATCNARSMMSFLSLRTKDEGSMFPSFPQQEIAMAAGKMEAEFERLFPITYEAFVRHGRVAP